MNFSPKAGVPCVPLQVELGSTQHYLRRILEGPARNAGKQYGDICKRRKKLLNEGVFAAHTVESVCIDAIFCSFSVAVISIRFSFFLLARGGSVVVVVVGDGGGAAVGVRRGGDAS